MFWRPNVLAAQCFGAGCCRACLPPCLRFLCRVPVSGVFLIGDAFAGRICRVHLQNMLAGVFALRRPGIAADITVDITAGINADKAADIAAG